MCVNKSELIDQIANSADISKAAAGRALEAIIAAVETTLKKGDEVVSGGGILGRITEIGENFVQLEVAEGVNIRIQKQAIGNLMPKGTSKGTL